MIWDVVYNKGRGGWVDNDFLCVHSLGNWGRRRRRRRRRTFMELSSDLYERHFTLLRTKNTQ